MSDEGFSSPTNITWQGSTGMVEYGGGDKGMICMFYNRPMHNPAKSKDNGRPVYEDKVFVRIHPPGERLNIVDREARTDDQRRWPMQWAQFKQNKQQTPEGTPIDLLFPDFPSVAATLRASGVHTIEQCAALSAEAIDTIGMGSQRYVNAAAKYLEAAGKGVHATQMRAELEVRDREIKVLKKTVEDLKAVVEDLRSGSQGQPQLADLQRLIAGVMQRPVNQPSQTFDAQTAQINATSATAQLTQAAANNKRRRVRVS